MDLKGSNSKHTFGVIGSNKERQKSYMSVAAQRLIINSGECSPGGKTLTTVGGCVGVCLGDTRPQ